MTQDEYTKRLEEIYVDVQGMKNFVQAIQQLNNKAIGETDIQVRGTTQNNENPRYWTKGTKVDYELRQELRNILGASNE